MTFRLANSDDMPVLLELLDMLFAIETDFTFDAEAAQRGFELMLQDSERSAIWLAEDEGRIVGMCTGQITISTAIGARSIWVEDVIVRPEYRGQGLMPLLLGELEKWGRERGVKRLQNLCDLHNAPALSFYAKRSQQTELICFIKLLD
ncbi:GNAT family N-acetyltransferase [bacterium]|nr:MAG: GNAT family N-acetyltransferase [bacterium]